MQENLWKFIVGVQLQCPCANLMIFSFKDVIKNVDLDFALLVLKASC